jgi:anthranilate phosphoribosyltransferase
MALVLGNLGAKHALVVHGEDGLEEITITGRTKVTELKDGRTSSYFVSPDEFGLQTAEKTDLTGGNAEDNAKITIDILEGKKGPKRDIVVMNSAASLITGEKANDFITAVKLSSGAIDSGAARKKLDEVRELSNKL